LCIVAYFQMSGLLMHLVHSRLALLVAASSGLALVTLVYLIRGVEGWRSKNLFRHSTLAVSEARPAEENTYFSVIHVDLVPLLEVGLWEESAQIDFLVPCLIAVVKRSVRTSDRVEVSQQKLQIFLSSDGAWHHRCLVEARVRARLSEFQSMFRLQYSIDGLPMRAERLKIAGGAA
jgi:hypothetical protein